MQLCPGYRCRGYVGKQGVKKNTPDCFKAVSVESYEHISMHTVYLRASPLPICRCAIMIRGKKCLNEIPAPQLLCRLPTRTCQLLLDQHPHDWKITTHIYKHCHRCEHALRKSTELSSIRFKYCKGSTRFKDIQEYQRRRQNRILLLLVWEFYWKGLQRQVCKKVENCQNL